MGRMEFTDGSEVTPKDPTLASLKADRIGQRLLGNFGYSDVLRSFDGIQFAYSNGPWTFTALGAIPTRGVFQVDGWGWVKTPVTYVALTRQAEFGSSASEVPVFGIYSNYSRPVPNPYTRHPAFQPPLPGGINISTSGGHFIVAMPTEA